MQSNPGYAGDPGSLNFHAKWIDLPCLNQQYHGSKIKLTKRNQVTRHGFPQTTQGEPLDWYHVLSFGLRQMCGVKYYATIVEPLKEVYRR